MPDDELMSTQGDTPCQSCGRRRPLVGITFPDSTSFQVCTHCAVVGIRTNGVSTAELHFPVVPDDYSEDDAQTYEEHKYRETRWPL